MDNSYLGSGPLYGDDPLINGALSPVRNDPEYFTDFYDDDLTFTDRVVAEETVEKADEFDFFQHDDTSPFTLAVGSPVVDEYPMGMDYGQFDFGFTTPFPDVAMPAVDETDLRMEDIMDEVTESPEEELQPCSVESAPMPEKCASPVPVNVEAPMPVIKISVAPVKSKTPIKRSRASGIKKDKPVVRNEGETGKQPAPAKSIPKVPKQRTLYPVKICRIVPPRPVHPPIRNSPYVVQPVPPRKLIPEHENSPDNMPTSNSIIPERNNFGKHLKPSSFIPRDQQSNLSRCSQCQSSFTSQLALEFHEVEKHSNVYAFECFECKKIYADIREANKHIMADHGKETVPLLDESIFGNGDTSENGKRRCQRRISGMIWSFLSKNLALSGKIQGSVEHNEAVKKEAKAFFNKSLKEFATQMGEALLEQVQVEETATINDLLTQQYIYGPCIRRIMLDSVPKSQVIRKRYYEMPPNSVHVPAFLPEHTSPFHTRLPPALPSFEDNPPVLKNQKERSIPVVQSQPVTTATIVQGRTITLTGVEPTSQLVFVPRASHQGRFVLAKQTVLRRTPVAQQPWDRTKMIRVEMPPILEHYAARDKKPVYSKQSSQ